MKNIFTLLFIFSLFSARAATYYFSASAGDDSRSTTQARSAASAWKTLKKLNSFFSSLQPGDSVLLKRGDTFYGSVLVKKSGRAGSPIVFGAYGTGSKPVITSLVTLGNWVSKGSGIWESYNISFLKTANIVLMNNQLQQIGRFPNSDAANKGYLTIESHSQKKSITDKQLNALPDWKGAELVIRSRRWVLDKSKITSHTGKKITYASTSIYEPIDDYGYFIQNNINTLDKTGEWYYNSATKKLSVYFGKAVPSSYIMQAATINNLITASGFSYIVFDNLNIKGANEDAFNIKNGSNINITNCDIAFSGQNGAMVNIHKYFRIENCSIFQSSNNGIDLGFNSEYAIIRNNKITNTSAYAGMSQSGDNRGIGISSIGNHNIIEYNEIKNTGYIGISFNGNDVTVKNNLVDSFCIIKDDGSGIYTYTGASNINKYRRKVIGNIIINGIGAPEGINDFKPGAEGIYLDDNSSGIEISGNTIANIPGKGIFLNNARDLIIRNNTIYNNNFQIYARQYRKIAGSAIRHLTVKQNIFFAKNNDQQAAYFTTEQNDNNLIGTLDSNYYARPIDDKLVILNSYVNSSGSRVNENLDLQGWKNKYNKDAASKGSPIQIEPYKLRGIKGSNMVSNGFFENDISEVSKTSCTTSWGNSGLMDGGYLKVTPYKKNASVYMNIGGLAAGKKYIVRYSVRSATNGNMAISTFIRKDKSPYNNLTETQISKVSTVRANNEMLFSSGSKNAATVVFRVNSEIKFYLDNIEVFEATASITNINDSIRFEYNSTKLSKTVNLEGDYVDVKNNKYAGSIVLSPFASAVLIKGGSNIDDNKSPEVNIISPAVNTNYKAKETIRIMADASDDEKISKVEFYNGTILLHVEYFSPYTYSWENVSSGQYTLFAKATDNTGNVTTSEGVLVSVASSSYPEVSITSPVENGSYKSGATISVSADASDADGSINKVEFYKGTTLLHTEVLSPYIWDWKNVGTGKYTLTAKATDNSGQVTVSKSVTISVTKKASNKSSANSDTSGIDNSFYSLNAIPSITRKENAKYQLQIFPNPAVNKIQINVGGVQANQKATINISNLSGIILKSMPLIISGKTVETDITSLKQGIYILTITTNHFTTSKKFIKN